MTESRLGKTTPSELIQQARDHVAYFPPTGSPSSALIDSLATALQGVTKAHEWCVDGKVAGEELGRALAAESKLAEAEGKLSRVRAWVDSQSFTADRGEAKAVVKRLLEEEGS